MNHHRSARCAWPGKRPCREVGNRGGGFCKYHRRQMATLGCPVPPTMVDAEPVRQRIEQHVARGGTRHSFAIRAGVTPKTVREVALRITRRVRVETSRAALELPLRPSNVGCVRRIRALRRVGYPVHVVAKRMGVSLSALNQRISLGSFKCDMAYALDAVYRELIASPVPSQLSPMAIRLAVKGRCVSHLAWTDIDDPDETPDWTVVRRVSKPTAPAVYPTAHCELCGKPFPRKRRAQRFCCPPHRRQAKEARVRAERQAAQSAGPPVGQVA